MKAKTRMDESQAAAGVVGETINRHSPLPDDLEVAWAQWSAGVANGKRVKRQTGRGRMPFG